MRGLMRRARNVRPVFCRESSDSTLLGSGHLIFAVALVASVACSQPEGEHADALDATSSWLQLVDQKQFGQSWDNASSFFRESVTRAQWEASMRTVRQPLGDPLERKLSNVHEMPQMPGAADGEYLTIRFESSFRMRPRVIERVALARQTENWEVLGYFVMPLEEAVPESEAEAESE
jgi:hypothetical protein